MNFFLLNTEAQFQLFSIHFLVCRILTYLAYLAVVIIFYFDFYNKNLGMNFSFNHIQLQERVTLPPDSLLAPLNLLAYSQLNFSIYDNLKYEYHSNLFNSQRHYTTCFQSPYSMMASYLKPQNHTNNVKIEEQSNQIKQEILQEKKSKLMQNLRYYDPSEAPLFVSHQQNANNYGSENKLSTHQNYQAFSGNIQQIINKQIKIQQKNFIKGSIQDNQSQSPFIILKKKRKKQRTRRFQLVLLRKIKKNMVTIKERAKKLLQGEKISFEVNQAPIKNTIPKIIQLKQFNQPSLIKANSSINLEKVQKFQEDEHKTFRNMQFTWKQRTNYFNSYFTLHLDDILKRKLQ